MTGGWPLTKVISGGQTGADLAGLAAAKWLRYHTGGMAPKGYRTETGPNLVLRDTYNLIECPVLGYRSRTYWNVHHSDGTVLFCEVPSNGSQYTLAVCNGRGDAIPRVITNPDEAALRAWIYEYRIRTLNVAGNRESKSPGIYLRVYNLLTRALLPF